MERDSAEEVRLFGLTIIIMLACPLFLFGVGNGRLSRNAVEVSGEGVYYLEGKDNLEAARSMAVEIARSNAMASVFGTSISSSAYSQDYASSDGDEFNSFTSLMRSLQTGIWIKDIDVPEVTSFMDGEASFGFKAKVRGLARPLTTIPVETKGRVFVGKGPSMSECHETDVLRRGEEFFFGFKAAADGFLAVYVVDEDENVCKAAPIGRNRSPLIMIHADNEEILRDRYLKNIADISRPESREVYNRVVYVFSPNEYTLPLTDDSYTSADMSPVMDFAKFHSWLQDMAVADSSFTVSWQTIRIRR